MLSARRTYNYYGRSPNSTPIYYSLTKGVTNIQREGSSWPKYNKIMVAKTEKDPPLYLANLIISFIQKHKAILTPMEVDSLKTNLIPILDQFLQNFECQGQILVLNKKFRVTPKTKAFGVLNKVVRRVVPMAMYGCRKNRNLFSYVLRKIIFAACAECMFLNELTADWNMNSIQYLENILSKTKVMQSILVWLLDHYIKPLITVNFHVTRMSPSNGYECFYIQTPRWKSFHQMVITKLIRQQHLKPLTVSQEKHFINRYYCGNLLVYPKKRGQKAYRIIASRLRIKSKYGARKEMPTSCMITKANRVFVNQFLYSLIHERVCANGKLEDLWFDYNRQHKGKTFFGAVVDITDAFGNINTKHLIAILKLRFKRLPTAIQQKKKRLLENIIEQINHQIISYGFYRRPSKQGLKLSQKVVRYYTWNHGLLQGAPFSSVLCDIYRCTFDRLHLQSFKNDESLLYRTVDDYLFVSTDKNQVYQFIDLMKSESEVNVSKIQSNLPEHQNDVLIFCGKKFNLSTGSVELITEFTKVPKDRWKFWNAYMPIEQPLDIVRNTLRFPMFQAILQKIFYCTEFNSKDIVLMNVARSSLYICIKFEAVVSSVYKQGEYPASQLFDFIRCFAYKFRQKICRQIGRPESIRYETYILHIFFSVLFYVFKSADKQKYYHEFVARARSEMCTHGRHVDKHLRRWYVTEIGTWFVTNTKKN